ncbi:hypothetical protein AVEN_44696-1 [Araneus ventricosus]|uniref:Uncharacterized protein n=1 Tax=Araneus ventricosus TaxID=182803 RepID=A0A4Y2X3R3_ARAVE|nr:hypothetical protein AVEN_182019-1 [Araneus ventricosus]GBO43079.1 hypothetical protein AVEN_209072-1 [Araneus ventricosus]GBO43521.1 hypothetical protein AVEN_5264-1 [Araneus ventricosus]GBO43524.1 hypothetical protein AVEN_44696-1 [Araneus ventricosus]
MAGYGWQATIDGIVLRHTLSYEIKMVEIGPVVGVGEMSLNFSPQRMYSGKVFFGFLSKMEGGGGQETTYGMSRRHKIPYEIKMTEIGPVVWHVVLVF